MSSVKNLREIVETVGTLWIWIPTPCNSQFQLLMNGVLPTPMLLGGCGTIKSMQYWEISILFLINSNWKKFFWPILRSLVAPRMVVPPLKVLLTR